MDKKNTVLKNLTVLIVDDEELARRLTCEYLKSHTDLHIIGECENGLEAVDAISNLQPDIVFLDIQMPKLNGLEVLEATGKQSGVIFTTAYDQYALKAFDQHAVDYLLKPYSQTRFDEAVNKARIMLGQTTNEVAQASTPSALSQLITETQTKLERIVVRDRGHTHIIFTKTIDYVEAQDDYINIHFEGKSLLKTQRISELEAQLDPEHFVRIHRSYLLQLSALKSIDKSSKDSHVAVLHNGTQLPISRSGFDRIKAML
jgi:two-component system LytT family response regulator